MESKNTCIEVFSKRLKELRKANGYTIEQFAALVGISKSSVGYYESANRLPDVEILSRIADALNVPADYLIGRTNTAALKGKMKTVCELTGLSDGAAEYLAQLVRDKDRGKLSVINHLFRMLNEDYAFYIHETENGEADASSVLGALFIYFEKFADKDKLLMDFLNLREDLTEEILSAAYKQYLLNQIADAVKADAEAYVEYNKPWE